ncbi:hypothetical protein Cgig2_025201 [Carnegiea gigantea]|uniref:OVATE domain-containing protein n=1 Tax=Carnegiea gigantea TaxID=171969 RepID=A0A9Q1KTC5_9CARY|nr:hypothetical protein Cgig2_025201 [Carnegiea gigantea]
MKMKAMSSFKSKVVDPCTKLLSKFKQKFEKPSLSLRTSTFRMPRRRTRPRIRTKVVRFRKPFSMKSLACPQCGRPKGKIRLRKKRRAAISSKLKRALHFRHPRRRPKPPAKRPAPRVRVAEVLTVLFSLRKGAKEVDVYDVDMEGSDEVTVGDGTSVSERGHKKEPFPSPITPAYVKHSGERKKDVSSDESEEVEVEVEVEVACRSFEKYLVEMIVEERKVKDLMDVEEVLYCWKNLKSPLFVELVYRFYGELCKDLFCANSREEHQSQFYIVAMAFHDLSQGRILHRVFYLEGSEIKAKRLVR